MSIIKPLTNASTYKKINIYEDIIAFFSGVIINYFYYKLWCLINSNENTHDSSNKKYDNNDLLSQIDVNIKDLAIPFDLISPL
jgi:hypothetical protein